MFETGVKTEIHCQQCTAPLAVEQGSQFVHCTYCGTTNFVDKSKAVLTYTVRSTLTSQHALATLRRWMAGNKTVKNLDKKAEIETPLFEYFPMWLVRVQQGEREYVFLEPAASISITELKHLTVPASDLQPYTDDLDGPAIPPTVPYQAIHSWLADNHNIQGEAIQEMSLIYVPIYRYKYAFEGRTFTALVDAATSKVFANIYPSKWEMPYMTIGVITFLIYFVLASIPAITYLAGGVEFLMVGLGAYCVAALILAMPIFIAASVVSAKA